MRAPETQAAAPPMHSSMDTAHGAIRTGLIDVVHEPFLSREECAEVLAALDSNDWNEAAILATSSESVDEQSDRGLQRAPTVRSTLHQPIPGGASGPLASRIAERIFAINATHHGFDLWGLEDPVHVLQYRGERRDHYIEHIDISPSSPLRKLSFTLLLSDPSEFVGGELELLWAEGPKEIGELVVFPSYLPHTVHPVTAGVRTVVVGWAIGPTFR